MVPQMGGAVWRCTYEGEWKDSREATHVEKFEEELEKNDTTANRSSVQS